MISLNCKNSNINNQIEAIYWISLTKWFIHVLSRRISKLILLYYMHIKYSYSVIQYNFYSVPNWYWCAWKLKSTFISLINAFIYRWHIFCTFSKCFLIKAYINWYVLTQWIFTVPTQWYFNLMEGHIPCILAVLNFILYGEFVHKITKSIL